MSDNWVVQNLANALDTWNDKLAEVWKLLTTSPEAFKGGGIWKVILTINGSLQAIGLALLVLFFLAGVVRTSANLGEIKRPEHSYAYIQPAFGPVLLCKKEAFRWQI